MRTYMRVNLKSNLQNNRVGTFQSFIDQILEGFSKSS